jgi:hypothetical protein
VFESQEKGYETFGCTVWGGLNQIETMHKYLYGEELNFSDRFNYVQVGIRPPGANPQNSYESFRNDGLVLEKNVLYPESYETFIKDNFSTTVYAEAQDWMKWHSFNHDWIVSPTKEVLKKNLVKCPLGIAVTAWIEEDGLYVDKGQPNTHWTVLYGFDGDIPLVFDSYDNSHKRLHPDHRISYAKRITYKKREIPIVNNWWTSFFRRFKLIA